MDWVMPEQLIKNPLWLANNQHNTVISLNQDFVASMHSDFFQGRADGAYSISLTILGKLGCLSKKKEVESFEVEKQSF
jgi:hypothetical protein